MLQETRSAQQEAGDHSLPADLEVSLAPREGELLSLPFDQYGRMRVAQNLAHLLYSEIAAQAPSSETPFRLRLLDVGGFPGTLRRFLSPEHFDVTVLDVVPDDGSVAGYVQGSGLALPYPEGEFDVVFALDTLEHIPGPDRPRFLSELARVARLSVVLINPVQSVQADLSEELLDEYIRWILDAQQEQLQEHRDYGLPDLRATDTLLKGDGWHTHSFALANVYNWLLMMVAKHYLLSMRDAKAQRFEAALDRFYNLSFSDGDRDEPGYRGALVAVRPGLGGVLSRVAELYPPTTEKAESSANRLALTQLLMELLNLKTANHEDRLLREQIERRDRHIAGMETRLATQDIQVESLNLHNARLEEHVRNVEAAYTAEFASQRSYITRLEEDVKSKDEHILYLERLLQGIESGRVFRLTRTVSRLLRR